jgi:hypothetical protein
MKTLMKRLRLALVAVCLLGPGSLLAEEAGEDYGVAGEGYAETQSGPATGRDERFAETQSGPATGKDERYAEIQSGPATARDERYIETPEGIDDSIGIPERGEGYTEILSEGEGYIQISTESIDETYVEIPYETVDESFVYIPHRGFSEGSRHGRSVYREMDHDDLDDEPMLQIYPSEDSGLNSLPPTIVPSGEGPEQTATIIPAGEISTRMVTAEDRVFNRLSDVPEEG